MNDKICPSCQTENTPDAEKCSFCGKPLRRLPESTEWVEGTPVGLKRVPEPHEHQLENDTVYLYIVGRDSQTPLTYQGLDPILLGRNQENPDNPSERYVDLTPYYGQMMGVSRRHARIVYLDTGYFVEDLGSTNGTWLNNNRLAANKPYPLRRGDQLQLGELLIFIYFFQK